MNENSHIIAGCIAATLIIFALSTCEMVCVRHGYDPISNKAIPVATPAVK